MRPMLAGTAERLDQIPEKGWASPKLDGIRGLVINGQLVSRNLKPIQNHYIRKELSKHQYHGFDGELIVEDHFSETTSAVMSYTGKPDFRFVVFDDFSQPELPFNMRYYKAQARVDRIDDRRIVVVHQELYHDHSEFDEFYNEMLASGYEGAMVRNPERPYKFGRSTVREAGLIKFKPFFDDEAVIMGFVEQFQNTNEATRSATGKIKRSSSKSGMVPKGVLGALVVEGLTGPFEGVRFNLGTGFTDDLRKQIWHNQDKYLGRTVTFQYMKYGSVDAPRFPTFQRFREE